MFGLSVSAVDLIADLLIHASRLIALLVVALFPCASARAVSIELVAVGNAGNAPDTRYNSISVGAVARAYYIGKHEVTAGQYTEFLNAVAKDDPYGLYNAALSDPTDFTNGANIQRTGSAPNYVYSVALNWADRPVNYVSWGDAARFSNWLHNGQPTGAQGAGTTEDGAYTLNGITSWPDLLDVARNVGAKFFIPTEHEWYKAAYHKNDGATGNYWNYPATSDNEPINTLPDPGNHANYYDVNGVGNSSYSIGSPYYRTNAGEYSHSASPYGTFDQGGNVSEWNETRVFSLNRGLRGGAFYGQGDLMHALKRGYFEPTFENSGVGFRVASIIPEPTTLMLVGFAVVACGCFRGRRG